VFGLGYVGTVTAACLADRGFAVTGVDVSEAKVEMLNAGRSPIVEEAIGDVIARARKAGKLRAIGDAATAVAETDLSLVCVGTPSRENGDLDLRYVRRVCEEIGDALAGKKEPHAVVLRSTVLPGSTETVVRPILEERSGRKAGDGWTLCFNPEFLREGSSVKDFHAPPFTLVGAVDPADAAGVRELYGWLDAEFIVTDIATSEMIKYVNNVYHALKICFANEVGRVSAALGIDSHRVMDIFCRDERQNLSAYYLKPGFAFGGSCLPKDLRAFLYRAKTLDVETEVIRSILPSNASQVAEGVRLVEKAGGRQVGLLGLSFKAGTDDLRESPLVTLAETLLGKGYRLRIYDANVSLARLVGSNRAYIEKEIPHIAELFCEDPDMVVAASDTIVIGNGDPVFADALARVPAGKTVIDLVRIADDLAGAPDGYRGIGW
jgi:GDP-mannose 6-dehydrogenase